jgi:methionyl-tRNA synthetase
MTDKKTFSITTAIPYVNGNPHVGHAYEAITTDVLARFKRLDGYDVFFLTGTDEHGQKNDKTAREEGRPTLDFVTEHSNRFREMDKLLNISNDDFIRTTEPRHHAASQAIWKAMADNGDIYLGGYSGWYSVRDEAYYAENELTKAEDGTLLSPQGTPVEWVEEESYFFRLSAYEDKLLALYDKNPDFILPLTRRNEVLGFVKQGLRDLSVSRKTLKWGVPVPGDPDHVMYVWVDALTNYITGLGYPDQNAERFKRYWPCDLHVIGKDIFRFHAIYWPAFLMSAGLAVPKRLFVHGFLYLSGRKMSKSEGNVIAPADFVEEFGLDQTRYFFCREVPFGNDGDYSREAIVRRINGDLANDLGNLCQRVLTQINRNCAAKVPEPGALADDDKALLDMADGLLDEARDQMDRQAIHAYLEALWRVVAAANNYVARQEPWALKKSDPARMATVLYVCAEAIRQVAALIQPVMPQAAARILDQLGVSETKRSFASLGREGRLVAGTDLPKPEGVFPRIAEPETSRAG